MKADSILRILPFAISQGDWGRVLRLSLELVEISGDYLMSESENKANPADGFFFSKEIDTLSKGYDRDRALLHTILEDALTCLSEIQKDPDTPEKMNARKNLAVLSANLLVALTGGSQHRQDQPKEGKN